MDDAEERAFVRVHEKIAVLTEKVASLHEHKLGADAKSHLERDMRDGDFRTLQEVSGLISGLRSDVKDWISTSRDENALKLAAAQNEIMAAIRADRSWLKQLPIYIALALGLIGLLSGNPHIAKMLSGAL